MFFYQKMSGTGLRPLQENLGGRVARRHRPVARSRRRESVAGGLRLAGGHGLTSAATARMTSSNTVSRSARPVRGRILGLAASVRYRSVDAVF